MILKLITALCLCGIATAQQPKVTVILMDDVGKEILAMANTPVIDSLAANGVVFQNAWAMPLCSPTRAALLTGKFPFETGIGGLVTEAGTSGGDMHPEEIIIPEVLGVNNIAIGKWHLGHGVFHPNLTGFTRYSGSLWNLNVGNNNGYYDWEKDQQGHVFQVNTFTTIDETNDAIAAQNIPFRYVCYHSVHLPAENPPGYNGVTDLEKIIAQMEFMDSEIGRLLQGYNGYVFLLGDNGGIAITGGAKGTVEEGGINVPFIVTGPTITPRVVDDLVNVTDIFATVADIYNVNIPPNAATSSISFLPILEGAHVTVREINFAETFVQNYQVNTMRKSAIRSKTHKLRVEIGVESLYSMPGEILINPPYTGNDLREFNHLKQLLETKYGY